VPTHQGVHLDIRLKRGLRELACSRPNDGGFAKPDALCVFMRSTTYRSRASQFRLMLEPAGGARLSDAVRELLSACWKASILPEKRVEIAASCGMLDSGGATG
jgi:hypothetical protein